VLNLYFCSSHSHLSDANPKTFLSFCDFWAFIPTSQSFSLSLPLAIPILRYFPPLFLVCLNSIPSSLSFSLSFSFERPICVLVQTCIPFFLFSLSLSLSLARAHTHSLSRTLSLSPPLSLFPSTATPISSPLISFFPFLSLSLSPALSLFPAMIRMQR